MIHEIIFDNHTKGYWIREINYIRDQLTINNNKDRKLIKIRFGNTFNKENFTPVHIVLLACLLEYIDRLNYNVIISGDDDDLINFLADDLKLEKYFDDKKVVHIDSEDRHIFNLWKIEGDGKSTKGYSDSITDYFERVYFKGYDLSVFQVPLDEVYSNVTDHSQSKGIAFSYIYYDEAREKIHIAVCDWGLGIPFTLKVANPQKYVSDEEALRQSLEKGITAKTKGGNKGMGLDNVISSLSNGDYLRIVSNKALLFCHSNKDAIKLYPLDFDFKGTLIYFEICIKSFQKAEEVLFDVSIG
jgi:hypothetical protein